MNKMFNEALRPAIALSALVGVLFFARHGPMTRGADAPPAPAADALGEVIERPPAALIDTGAALGFLLLGAWLFARLLDAIKAPHVFSYLLFGLLAGPKVLNLITAEELPYLQLTYHLAIALIALTAGGEIRLSGLRGHVKPIFLIASGGVLAVLLTMTPTIYLAREAMGITESGFSATALMLALLVATLATANSPAVVIAMLTELRAAGPMSRLALSVTILKDLFLIVLFTIVLALVVSVGGGDRPDGAHVPPQPQGSLLLGLVAHLGGSLLAGAIVGVFLAWYTHAVRTHLPIFVIFACFGIALVSEALMLEPLIVALVAGLLMRNIWARRGEPLFDAIEELSLPVYCVFFAVAGASLHLEAIGDVWALALLYVAVRISATCAGTWAGAYFGGVEPKVARWLPTAFIPQAGVSVALAAAGQRALEGEPFADPFYNLVVVGIAMHEMIGPIFFKIGLARAGELPASPR